MKIVTDSAELRREMAPLRGQKIAFVPTMGCLHAGHLSLIRRARELADLVVVSIYVNPRQFAPNEDLDRYPRPFERDAALCAETGVDLLFHPDSLYPADAPQVTLTLNPAHTLSSCLCGAARPGHFDGVVTVVNILFNLVQPDLALFGEKDWQQLAVIRRMVNDLQMAVEIVPCATVREADGLAMSSRNHYLSAGERQLARHIPEALQQMQQAAADGTCDAHALIAAAERTLAAVGLTAEYLEIRHAETLAPLTCVDDAPARAFIACRIGATRLIDNIPLIFSRS